MKKIAVTLSSYHQKVTEKNRYSSFFL